MLMAYSMYLIGIVVAIVVSAVIHLLDRKKSVNYLMIELPEYKLPIPGRWPSMCGRRLRIIWKRQALRFLLLRWRFGLL